MPLSGGSAALEDRLHPRHQREESVAPPRRALTAAAVGHDPPQQAEPLRRLQVLFGLGSGPAFDRGVWHLPRILVRNGACPSFSPGPQPSLHRQAKPCENRLVAVLCAELRGVRQEGREHVMQQVLSIGTRDPGGQGAQLGHQRSGESFAGLAVAIPPGREVAGDHIGDGARGGGAGHGARLVAGGRDKVGTVPVV